MSEARFTPGPWLSLNMQKADPLGGKRWEVWVDTLSVARISGGFSKPDSSEAEANAHLIAAAPDLFAALEALREHHCDGVCYADEDHTTVLAQVAAALARARGETP